MSDVSVVLNGVGKTYPGGVEALRDIDLEIGAGLFGLLGPNGAGKTTLIRLVSTLLRPSSGSITVDGHDVTSDRRAVRSILGYLPQQSGVYPRLSAFEHVRYFASLKGLGWSEAGKESARLLEMVGLLDVAGRRVGGFSQGMKQRLGIAVALIGDPKLLVVDEPTAGLDPEERVRFRNLLAQVARDAVVILSTHIVQDVEIGCSRVVVIANGQVVSNTTPEAMVANARDTVWTLDTSPDQLVGLKRRYAVMSEKHEGDRVSVRLVSKEMPVGAVPASPQLEDAYVGLVHAVRNP